MFIVQLWGPSLALLRRYAWCWVAGAIGERRRRVAVDGWDHRAPGRPHPPSQPPGLTCALAAGLALALWLGGDGWRRHLALAFFGVLAVTVVRAGSRAGLLGLLVTTAVIL